MSRPISVVPLGVSDCFTASMTPAADDLPRLVVEATEREPPPSPDDVKRFQAIMGSLLYCATHTRPGVAYAVGLLCRAMSRPTPELFAAAQRVLYYLLITGAAALSYSAEWNLTGVGGRKPAIKTVWRWSAL